MAAALAAHRPGVPAAWLAAQLGFADAAQLCQWATGGAPGLAVVTSADGEQLLCREAPQAPKRPAAPAEPPAVKRTKKKSKHRGRAGEGDE